MNSVASSFVTVTVCIRECVNAEEKGMGKRGVEKKKKKKDGGVEGIR